MIDEEVDAFIIHYGIKGMRWGVQKDQSSFYNPKSSKEFTKKASKHAKQALKPSTDARIDRLFGKSQINYSELSTKEVILKRGQEFARITQRKNETLRDMTYAAYTKEDRARYVSVMANVQGLRFAKRSYKPTYEVTLKATKNLKSPSEKVRLDAFVELMSASVIPVGLRGKKTLTGREYLARTGLKREVKRLDNQQLGEKYYHAFVANQFANRPLNTAYFNSIKAKGFNALMDDNDRGIVADEPIMILDTKGSIKTTKIRQLTNDEINTAAASLTPIKTKSSKAT